jgi:hypothetical protein
MTKYIAKIEIDGALVEVEIEASSPSDAIEKLWERYGMSSYIESVRELIEVTPEGD